MASWVHRVPLELPHTLTSAECSGSLGPGPLPVALCTLRLSGRGALGPFMEEGRERWEPSRKLWHVLSVVRSWELSSWDQPSLQVGNLRSSKGSSKLGLEWD